MYQFDVCLLRFWFQTSTILLLLLLSSSLIKRIFIILLLQSLFFQEICHFISVFVCVIIFGVQHLVHKILNGKNLWFLKWNSLTFEVWSLSLLRTVEHYNKIEQIYREYLMRMNVFDVIFSLICCCYTHREIVIFLYLFFFYLSL